MSLGEHLTELRRRIILALIGIGVALVVCMVFVKPLVRFMANPVYDAVRQVESDIARQNAAVTGRQANPGPAPAAAPDEPLLVVLAPTEVFVTSMKTALVAAIVLASPWVLYQFWLFIAAGLYPHERRIVYIFLPISVVLFLAGAVFAYTVVLKYGLYVLLTFAGLVGDMVRPTIRLSAAINFVLMIAVLMGCVFQLPLVMLALAKVGLVKNRSYVRYWRYALAGIFIAAAVITPTGDAFNMIAMAAPMLVLYWLGVLLVKLFVKERA